MFLFIYLFIFMFCCVLIPDIRTWNSILNVYQRLFKANQVFTDGETCVFKSMKYFRILTAKNHRKTDFTTSNIRNELFSRWDLDLPYQCHLYTEWHPVKLLRQIHINEVNSFCVHGNVSCVKKTLCKITHVLIWYNGGNVWYEESFMYAQLFEEETCTL